MVELFCPPNQVVAEICKIRHSLDSFASAIVLFEILLFKPQVFVYLTNHFELAPDIIAELYGNRWKIELFFKWIKQHLRIKAFYGTSVNIVYTQVWIAISA
jgi:IS4 transposase